MRITAQSRLGYCPCTSLCLQNLVPLTGLEPARLTAQRPQHCVATNYTTKALNTAMTHPNTKEVNLVNLMLSRVPVTHQSVKDQMLYERGYLTGFLASLAASDSYIRSQIIDRINELDEKRGGR